MATNVPDFPMPVRMVYERDNGARASFMADLAALASDGKKQFERAFGEVGSVIERSIAGLRQGNFNFAVDLPGLRQVAANADFAAQRLSVMRDAAVSLAQKTGDTTAKTKTYIDALRAQTVEAQRAKSAADAQVTTYTRLQRQIDQTIAGNGRLADSYRTLFLEEARAANFADRSQRAVNAGFAPSLNRQTKSARDSANVFENALEGPRIAPRVDTRSAFDRFKDGQASLDRAAASATTLDQVLGRVASKGPAVSAALESAARAAEEEARALARAGQEAERLAADLARVEQQRLTQAAAEASKLASELDRIRGSECGDAQRILGSAR